MLGELGEGESAAEGIPQDLAHDLIHLMAHQKMVVETQHILSRCHTDDAMVVVGSDVKLRLDILAIDEALENALLNDDPNEPSRHFECLLERFDLLRKSLANVSDKPIVTEEWPKMRAALVRQAALSFLLAQQRSHAGPDAFDWGKASTKPYIRVVKKLFPEMDTDPDALQNEEQVSASKEGRNLADVFLEKRRGVVSSLKIRTLLKENKLSAFERDMKAFTRALDQAVLPKPKLLELYDGSRLLDDSADVVHVADARHAGLRSPSKSSMGSPARRPTKRKAGSMSAPEEAPLAAHALAKANDSLQQELEAHPGAVEEALAISEGIPPPSSPAAKRTTVESSRGGPSGKRSAKAAPRRSERSVTRRESGGQQVDFDDSQSIDEPQDTMHTLANRETPGKTAELPSPARAARPKKSGQRSRIPWTEEEVKHLKAAVMALGKGRWALALAQYKFNPSRTSVDLKDKWRNLSKG